MNLNAATETPSTMLVECSFADSPRKAYTNPVLQQARLQTLAVLGFDPISDPEGPQKQAMVPRACLMLDLGAKAAAAFNNQPFCISKPHGTSNISCPLGRNKRKQHAVSLPSAPVKRRYVATRRGAYRRPACMTRSSLLLLVDDPG
jgi:hypothetical protein